MSTGLLIFLCVGATTLSTIVWLLLSSDRSMSGDVARMSTQKPEIERGLRTACNLITRFYSGQELYIRIVSGVIGYQTATIRANVSSRINTAKVMRTKKDLEHFLLAHSVHLIPGTLDLDVSGQLKISWGRRADKVVYLSKVYRAYYSVRGNQPVSGVFPVGLDMEGNPYCVTFDSEASPHAMIVGSTGAGKSVAAMCIAIGALFAEWEVYILNPKVRPKQERRLGLWDFEGFDGVTYIRSYGDMVVAMNRLSQTLELCEKPVLVIADELADSIEAKGKELATPLGMIAQKGREYGVHLLGIAPKTTKSVLGDDMLHANSATTLIGLRTNTRYLSQYGTGIGGMNLDTLSGNGHAKIRSGSETTEIQIALPDNIETVRKNGGVVHNVQGGLLPITERWITELPSGASVSKDALRKFASNNGSGIGYDVVTRQYKMLVERGQIQARGEYQAGVKT